MTLDLGGAREFAARVARPHPWSPRLEDLPAIEARLAAPYHRMAAWLWPADWLSGPELRAAGVPRGVVRLLAGLRRHGWTQPPDDWARAVLRTGAGPVARAGLTRPSQAELVVALDKITATYGVLPVQQPPPPDRAETLLHEYRTTGSSAALRALRTHLTDERLLLSTARGDDNDRLRALAVRNLPSTHVPFFIDLLRQAADLPETAAAAAEALGKAKAPEATAALLALLHDDTRTLTRPHRAAAEALGHIHTPDAETGGRIGAPSAVISALAAQLTRRHGATSRAAARALAAIGGEEAVTALLSCPSLDTAWGLGHLRAHRAVPTLIGWLRTATAQRSSSVALGSAEALGKIGAPEAAPALAEAAAQTWYPGLRREAVWALARTDPDAAVDTLLLAAADPDRDVRLQSATALAACRDPRAVIGLVTLLRTATDTRSALRRPTLRETALRESLTRQANSRRPSRRARGAQHLEPGGPSGRKLGLGDSVERQGRPEDPADLDAGAEGPTSRRLEPGEAASRQTAVWEAAFRQAVVQETGDRPGQLRELADRENAASGTAASRTVLRALAARPDPRTAPALLETLQSAPDRHTRLLAGRAIIALGPDVVRQVGFLVGSPDLPVRRAAIAIVGQAGSSFDTWRVAARLKDPDEITRARAARALGHLGPSHPTAEPHLRDALQDPVPRVRAAAVLALGAWRRPEDEPFLQAASRDTHPDVRAAAAAALRTR